MTSTFESDVKTINANDKDIFILLSDLRNVEKLKDKIPQDKVKDIQADCDTVTFSVNPIGEVSLKVIEREEFKTIKFAADKAPVDFFLWIQLKQVAEMDTKLKITLKAELNPVLKMMASKPLGQFVDMLAEALTKLPYTNDLDAIE
jgi:carbon monoxide dehydrogenase subunit G